MKRFFLHSKGMRLAFTLIAMLALTMSGTAQKPNKYDNSHKYGLFSNIEIGVGGLFSYDFDAHAKNGGASLLVTKRIGNNWRIRGEALVNGFAKNGFERMGMGMVGLSLDLLPFYAYGEYGLNYNPSATTKVGFAARTGAGLQFKLSKSSSIAVGGNFTVANNGDKMTKNAGAELTYIANLGVTERDREEIEHDQTMRSEYGELKNTNKLMKTEMQKCTEASATIQAAAEQMQQMLLSLQSENASLKQDNKEISEKCKSSGFQVILFQTGSSSISVAQEEIISEIAEKMLQDDSSVYNIIGYSSASGNIRDNLALSQERAEAVYNLLLYYDVPEYRLMYGGAGPTDYYKLSDQKVVIERIK